VESHATVNEERWGLHKLQEIAPTLNDIVERHDVQRKCRVGSRATLNNAAAWSVDRPSCMIVIFVKV